MSEFLISSVFLISEIQITSKDCKMENESIQHMFQNS